ncbi:oligosaccharide flippase family protein [Streptococcus acidominimus]|uniref:Lipopolysaccharide biosynthesis protein n=1 Tax=Streptococcus acidominimus TaxID=1326 RepID=A0A4Y9FRD2_STRAI|nr:lipopolysaccharide biosynthesis protein [Streptococcus acidominimus]MBF0818580.1 lipopolysaccharide biosynthesis protein [Streptococcus acidominimus]MBF0838214.1 lipopolysaccharide biosynthesis protein [Streptococcus acidominimus]MBF0847994.1 lipopolysaccharide biosynthesis protein [Streptococcus danieliae]TFU31080.1 lipopolysaccharide biosynthesis protein [Streptococcus acidominimus]
MDKVSPRKVFFWNILGSMSSAIVSVILLFVVTRILSSEAADVYSFAYAIANLLVIIASFQVRDYQATDIREKYSFDAYLATRLVSNILMVFILIGYLIFNPSTHTNIGIMFWVSFFRVSEALSDVFQGLFQQKERLDIAGKSLALRNTFSTLIFILSLLISQDLLLSIILQTLVSFVFIAAFDIPKSKNFHRVDFSRIEFKEILGILQNCLPLFINAFLLVSIYNQPKYALNDSFNQGLIEAGVQRDFSILFTPIFAMNLMVVFLRPMITQLAVFKEENKIEHFITYKNNLFKILWLTSGLICLLGAFLAVPVLDFIYRTDLKQYQTSFLILLAGGIASTFSTVCDNILTVFRKQHYLVISFTIGYIVSLVSAEPFVSKFKVLGASLSFLVSMLAWLVASLIIYFITNPYTMFRKKNKV